MKVVFLDLDGVIVPLGKASLSDKAIAKAVKNFNHLLKEVPDLKIVISSSWRHHGISYCKRFLEGLGINPDRVVGATGNEHGSRGHQIQLFLNREPKIKKFVILDDNSDMDHLMNKLVKTSQFIGLTEKDVQQAVELLKD